MFWWLDFQALHCLLLAQDPEDLLDDQDRYPLALALRCLLMLFWGVLGYALLDFAPGVGGVLCGQGSATSAECHVLLHVSALALLLDDMCVSLWPRFSITFGLH